MKIKDVEVGMNVGAQENAIERALKLVMPVGDGLTPRYLAVASRITRGSERASSYYKGTVTAVRVPYLRGRLGVTVEFTEQITRRCHECGGPIEEYDHRTVEVTLYASSLQSWDDCLLEHERWRVRMEQTRGRLLDDELRRMLEDER